MDAHVEKYLQIVSRLRIDDVKNERATLITGASPPAVCAFGSLSGRTRRPPGS
jgi:hypothetical protein